VPIHEGLRRGVLRSSHSPGPIPRGVLMYRCEYRLVPYIRNQSYPTEDCTYPWFWPIGPARWGLRDRRTGGGFRKLVNKVIKVVNFEDTLDRIRGHHSYG
jgi:hypothetical protein